MKQKMVLLNIGWGNKEDAQIGNGIKTKAENMIDIAKVFRM